MIKRFNMVIADTEGNFYYHDNITDEKITSTLKLENKLNELNDEKEQLNFNYRELRYANNIYCEKIDSLKKENEQLKQQLNKVFVLLDIKQKISKENMEEWAFKEVPASTTKEYYYSGMLDACMQLRDEILNGDVDD